MWHMEDVILRLICLGVGYGFGNFLTAEVVARIVEGKSARKIGTGNPGVANIAAQLGVPAGLAVLAGDILKTAAACLICGNAVPRLEHLAVLYAGFGVVLGHDFPLWGRGWGGKGVAVTCTWLILYLPVTGVLCCLAGGALTLGLGYLPLGAVAIALAAVPMAWLQYGTESGLLMGAAALVMVSRHFRGLQRIVKGEERRFFFGREP